MNLLAIINDVLKSQPNTNRLHNNIKCNNNDDNRDGGDDDHDTMALSNLRTNHSCSQLHTEA